MSSQKDDNSDVLKIIMVICRKGVETLSECFWVVQSWSEFTRWQNMMPYGLSFVTGLNEKMEKDV